MKKKLTLTLIFIVCATTMVAGGFFIFNNRAEPVFSNDIMSGIDFPAHSPTENEALKVDRESAKLVEENNLKILSYQVSYNGNILSITQQAYPDVLIYDKLTNSISPYGEFSTRLGKVVLGKPKGQNVAVVNPSGSLIFATSQKELTDDQWKDFFNSFRELEN